MASGKPRIYTKANGERITATSETIEQYKLVKRYISEHERFERAKERFENFKREKILAYVVGKREDLLDHKDLKPSGQKKSGTIYGENGEKVIVSYRTTISVDADKAETAKGLVEEEIRIEEEKSGKIPEVLRFLLNAFGVQKKWSVGPAFVQFIKADFASKNLRRAQELLLAAIEARESKLYCSLVIPDEVERESQGTIAPGAWRN